MVKRDGTGQAHPEKIPNYAEFREAFMAKKTITDQRSLLPFVDNSAANRR